MTSANDNMTSYQPFKTHVGARVAGKIHPASCNPSTDMAATTFHLFPNFPAELRIEIWRFAATPTPSDIGMPVCTFPDVRNSESNETKDPIVLELGCPAMLRASRESRVVALQCGIRRAYNANTDVLYVPSSRFSKLRAHLISVYPYGSRGVTRVTWMCSVRRLAFHHREPGFDNLVGWLGSLPSLEQISIIFPRSGLDLRWTAPRLDLNLTALGLPTSYLRTGPGLRLAEHLDAFYEYETSDTQDSKPDRSYMKEFQAYYQQLARDFRRRHDDRTYYFPPIDLGKIWRELEERLGMGVMDELVRLEFDLNKATVKNLQSTFKNIGRLDRLPTLPSIRYEASYACW